MLKKTLKVTAFVVVALITLIALLCVEETVRGKAAWERHLRELEAKGDTLDILKLVPPPVADAQNMAAAPIFAELMTATNQDQTRLVSTLKKVLPKDLPSADWRLTGAGLDMAKLHAAFSNKNILVALQPAEAVLKEVEEAAARPQCRFPIQYEKGFACLLPHLSGMRHLARTLQVRALAELEAGQIEAAFHDVRLILRLARATDDEPMLISLLVHAAYLNIVLPTVQDGLTAHRWNEAQLRSLQEEFAAIDLLRQLESALHSERCKAKWCLDTLLTDPELLSKLGGEDNRLWFLIPSGFIYFNCLNVDLFYQEHMLDCVESRSGRIYPARAAAIDVACENIERHRNPYRVLEALLIPAVSSILVKIGVAQTMTQSATLACALERYRLANGKLPEKLDALVPQFIAELPRDVIDGQPLRYRLDGPHGYVLYSIGWNQKDDGGQQVLTRQDKPRVDDKQGDWVWRSTPAPAGLSEADRVGGAVVR
jgi:hypothetical protein